MRNMQNYGTEERQIYKYYYLIMTVENWQTPEAV
jgi:hypothetical protein